MGDENELQVNMGMSIGIAFENGYGFQHRYGYGSLKPVFNHEPDLLVKDDKNMLKSKNKC